MRFRRGPAVALLVVGSLLPVARAGAEPSKGDRIAALQEQIGEASRAEVTASARLGAVQQRRATLDARVAALDAQIGAVRARVISAQQQTTWLTAAALELDRR